MNIKPALDKNTLKVKIASFRTENWRFWSGLRDLNPRSLGPKPSAIPNFAKPGYEVKNFLDVVKHVVKGYFRPEQGRSQGEKVPASQRVFELAGCYRRFGASAPKPSAIPNFAKPGWGLGCGMGTRDILDDYSGEVKSENAGRRI